MLFERLPEVPKCCFCIPLQYGPIFIALYCIILNFLTVFKSTVVVCYVGVHNKQCEFKPQLRHVDDVINFIAFLYIAPSILLIVGVFMKKRCLVTCFLYCFSVASAVEVALEIVIMVVSAYMPHCNLERASFLTCFIATLIHIAFSIYCIIAVKSFRTSISERTSTDVTMTMTSGDASKTSILLADGRRLSVHKKSLDIKDTRPPAK